MQTGTQQSPLAIVVVQQHELALAARLADARQAADRTIQAANEWATNRRREAADEGRALAEADYRAGLEAVDAEVAAIRAEAERAARALLERHRPHVESFAHRARALVLPPDEGA